MLTPELEKLAARTEAGLIVAKLDVDTAPLAARRHGAQSVPLLVLFQNGREVWRAAGARPAARLEQEVRAALARAA
jgi:thioredoxin-like negative regulator of GroEL